MTTREPQRSQRKPAGTSSPIGRANQASDPSRSTIAATCSARSLLACAWPQWSQCTATIGTPGQNARLTFAGQSGQRISLKLAPVTISSSYVSILKPDGAQLAANVYVSSSGGFVDTKTLPATGTYTIVASRIAGGRFARRIQDRGYFA